MVETHAEMLLLRARRWVAEGRLSPEDVAIYWVDDLGGAGAQLRRIGVSGDGEVEHWPEGVFYEDYEEVLAIRRAVRDRAG